jgi:hypothetical protein
MERTRKCYGRASGRTDDLTDGGHSNNPISATRKGIKTDQSYPHLALTKHHKNHT